MPNENTDPQDDAAQAELKFTQADVDRIITGRLAKYADYEDLKRQLADAQKERESAIETAKTETRAEVTNELAQRIVRSEAKVIAAGMNFRNADDALRFIDLAGLELDAEGNVNTDSLKTMLDETAKDRPYLLAEAKDEGPAARDAGLGAQSTQQVKSATPADAFANLFS